jgi:hypothetical protein
VRLGKPDILPPPKWTWGTRSGRIEDYRELRSWDVPRAEAARRLKVCQRTIERYERSLRETAA